MLRLACGKEVGHGDAPTFTVLANWLIGRKATWAPNTWRQYKAAVIHRLGAMEAALNLDHRRSFAHADRALQVADWRAAVDLLQDETQAGCAKRTTQTSARKAKRLPEHDRVEIAATLARMRSRNAEALNDLLLAGVRTGLRPVEWATVAMLPSPEPGTLILLVQNAKADDKRAHGPTRTLRLKRLPEQERAAIERWVLCIQAEGTDAETLMKALSDLLYTVTRATWPTRKTHYTLYSARHEFAAVAKLKHSPSEVAALMGHATDVTATDHYGRYRPSGEFPPELKKVLDLLPEPDPEEVLRVRLKLAERLSRIPTRRSSHALEL